MSIKTDAQVIRDETAAGANTATRVGTNLVAIADDLIAKQVEIDANTAKVGVTTEEANPDVVSQAEAEAGIATTERIWTAERVKQAIDALSSGSVDESANYAWTGLHSFGQNVDFLTNNLNNVSAINLEYGTLTSGAFTGLELSGINGVSIEGGLLVVNDAFLVTSMTNAQIDSGGLDTLITKGWFNANNSGGSGHTIQDNGTPLTDRASLNFITGLIAVDNAGNTSTDVSLDTSDLFTTYTDSPIKPKFWGGTDAQHTAKFGVDYVHPDEDFVIITDGAPPVTTASDIVNTPSGNLTSDNVQGALDELQAELDTVIASNMDTTNNSIVGDSQIATGDGATTVDWALGNTFDFQFGAFNEVFTFTNPNKAGTFMLKLVQDSVGSRTATFPASVKWSGGTAPTLTTTATTGTDIITFYFDGTDYFAVEVLDFS